MSFLKRLRSQIAGPNMDQPLFEPWLKIAEIANLSAVHLLNTKAGDLATIVKYEREGDKYKKSVLRYLESTYILTKFKDETSRRLTKQLDGIIGAMKRVAEHVQATRVIIGPELPAEALKVLKLVPEMVIIVSKLTTGLCTPGSLSVAEQQQLAAELDAKETEADEIHLGAVTKLYEVFNASLQSARDAVKLSTHRKLLDLLEDVIDEANHAGGSLDSMIAGRN